MKKTFYLFSLFLPAAMIGQVLNSAELENALAQGQPVDALNLWEAQEELFEEGLAINYASKADLMACGLFDLFQVNNLLQYRERGGTIYSAAELMQIKGFDLKFVKAIQPYLNFSPKKEYGPIYKPWQSGYHQHRLAWRWAYRFNKAKAYKNGQYLGDPWESRLRYRYKNGKRLQLGLLLQKDPGEAWNRSGNFLGYDHSSFFIKIQKTWQLDEVIIGDFQHHFGQGLSLSSGRAFDNSLHQADLKSYPRGGRAYAGSDENLFFRGLHLKKNWSNWKLSGFLSRKGHDARMEIEADQEATALINTGLHRTLNEWAQKNKERLFSAGLDLQFENNIWQWGLLWFYEEQKFDALSKRGQLVPASGIQRRWASHFNYLHDQLNTFGEITVHRQGVSAVLGLQMPWNELISGGLSFHHFAIGDENRWRALPQSMRQRGGEQGLQALLHLAWAYQQKSTFKLSYSDFFWPSFPYQGPGERLNLEALHLWSGSGKKLQINARLFWEKFKAKEPSSRELRGLEEAKGLISLQWEQSLRPGLSIKSRLAARKKLFAIATAGIASLQIKWDKGPWRVQSGLAYINIEDWDLRIYNYEPDLWLSFSIPAYYGRSLRYFLLSTVRVNNWLQLQARLEYWQFYDREKLGSGNEEIDANYRLGSKLQLVVKL